MDSDEYDEATLNQIFELTEAAAENLSKDESKETTPTLQHLQVLSKYFGHNSFRPLQWEIISAVIKDKRDVCAVMCTGYGKSICFQYPSTFLGGITLVISPLISLMEDQILSLQVSNIPACLLGSAQRNQSHVIDEIFKNVYRVVYLTPEFCGGEMGRELLLKMDEKLNINLIAIDEAHCISSWGHDFRHQYRQLGHLRKAMPRVPIMAVTATATCRVRQDIVESLNLRNPLMVVSSFNRPNLYFQVYPKGSNGVLKDLNKVMTYTNSGWRFSGPTIIYCITRKQTEEVTETLLASGIKCRSYHAGLPLKKREEVHEQFIKDKVDVIVATIAFGMGIDKPDVRNVVHYGAFKSIESYYQEAGRAGRDGLPSICSVFFSAADFATIRFIQESSSLKKTNLKMVEDYLITRECRRRFILSYFEEKLVDLDKPQTNCCDNCTKKLTDSRSDQEKYEGVDERGRYDFTKDARLFLEAVELLRPGLGITTYILFLRGSNSKKILDKYKKHKLHGAGRNSSEEWWKALGRLLIQEKYLDEQSRKTQQGFNYTTILISSKGKNVLGCSDLKIMLKPPSSVLHLLKKKPQKQSVVDSPQLSRFNHISRSEWLNVKPNMQPGPSLLKIDTEIEDKEKMDLYKKLLDGRADLSTKHDCMPYIIASNTALMKMAQCKPTTREELRRLNLDGFTEGKILKFGDKFLKIINGIPEEDNNEKKPMENVLNKPRDDSDKRLDALLSYADQIKHEEDSDATDIEDEPPIKKEKTEIEIVEVTNIKVEPPIKKEKTEMEIVESPQKTDFDRILDSPPPFNSNPVVTDSSRASDMVTNKGPVDEVLKSPKTKISKKSKKNLPPWLSSKKIV